MKRDPYAGSPEKKEVPAVKKYILPVSLTVVSYGIYGFVLYTLYHAEPNRHDGNLFIFSILFVLASYVLTGVALTILARSVKPSLIWMAWIPFARLYLLGALADLYTDNRMVPKKADHLYRRLTSKLRYQLPWVCTGNVVSGMISVVAFMLFLVFSFIPLAFMAAAIYYGEDFSNADLEVAIPMLAITFGGTWLAITTVLCNLTFGGLSIFSRGVSLHRIYRALRLPCAPLWAVVSVPNPLLASLFLLIYATRTKDRAQRFLPPEEPPAETPTEPPTEPPEEPPTEPPEEDPV